MTLTTKQAKTHAIRPRRRGESFHDSKTYCGRDTGRIAGVRYGAEISAKPTCKRCAKISQGI